MKKFIYIIFFKYKGRMKKNEEEWKKTMHGITHCLIGFMVGEWVWQYLSRNKKAAPYSRIWFWVLGMIGGYTPDFDGLPGISAIIQYDKPWTYENLCLYHHYFTHSLGFLIVPLLAILFLVKFDKKLNLPSEETTHPLGKTPLEKFSLSPKILGLFIITFFFYRNETKYLIFFLLLFFMVLLSLAYAKEQRPWYGITFFVGIFFHLLADIITNNFNPFGPWDPSIIVGFQVIYGIEEWSLNWIIRKLLLEGPFYVLVVITLYRVWRKVIKYEKEIKKN
jgi:membrane-bound metal-dependent hydrolase YbcI (DUF457 family)